MKKLIVLLLFAFPMTALADYVDVIAGRLKEGCSMATYLAAVKDFNEQWAKDYSYKAQILVPVQSQDVTTFYWVGRIATAEGFGKGLDAWNAGLRDPNSAPAKLMARFQACTTNLSRSGFLTY